MSDVKKVGMNVKLARVKANMTISELAEQAKMSVTTTSIQQCTRL